MNKELNIFISSEKSIQLEWSASTVITSKDTQLFYDEVFNRFNKDSQSDSESFLWLLYLAFCDTSITCSASVDYFRKIARLFTKALIQTEDIEILRQNFYANVLDENIDFLIDDAPMMIGVEYISKQFIKSIITKINKEFANQIKEFKGTVDQFIKTYSVNINLLGRVFFHLVENKNADMPFAFLATYSTKIDDKGKSKHIPLKYALKEYENNNEKLLELLSTVNKVANQSELIFNLIETGELFHPLSWSPNEAFLFLKEISIYEDAGILCRIPNWWKKSKSSSSINIGMGEKQPSFVGLNAILSFSPELFLADNKITEKEARELLEKSEGLAFIKNKWVEVDHEKLKKTLKAFEKIKDKIGSENFTLKDALNMQLNSDKFLDVSDSDEDDIDITMSKGKWINAVTQKMLKPNLIANVTYGKDFKATLRNYQQQGLNWLNFLHNLNFGACLADDMGLGKTIQMLGFLSVIKKTGNKKNASILIIPASLIFNWISEIKKFFPSLKYLIAHQSYSTDNNKNIDLFQLNKKFLNDFDLVITTYKLSQKYEWIKTYDWQYIILDEAQAIKNPQAKQTKAVKQIKAKNRIILTGTPIENRISDLWSLFDFLNPGLLGNKKEFSDFIKKSKSNLNQFKKLRKIISPYILRRLKTDKSIITDLPDKIEMKTYADLSKKQIVLYKDLIIEIEKIISKTDGIARKGLILASLMKFKQLCNHPDQYLGNFEYEEKHSGKFLRLKQICETIYEKREKVIIFTQFKEIIDPLLNFLNQIFNSKGLVLHGSVSVKNRKKIIEQFQSPTYIPFMILSLKAGGVGLNLTQANHVIHFDRWWNPAVENQATDRAFRIGQTKKVIVHKFLTKGTVEEKIDKMIEEKTKLSNDIISQTGDNWITEMNNDDLFKLFKLSI